MAVVTQPNCTLRMLARLLLARAVAASKEVKLRRSSFKAVRNAPSDVVMSTGQQHD